MQDEIENNNLKTILRTNQFKNFNFSANSTLNYNAITFIEENKLISNLLTYFLY